MLTSQDFPKLFSSSVFGHCDILRLHAQAQEDISRLQSLVSDQLPQEKLRKQQRIQAMSQALAEPAISEVGCGRCMPMLFCQLCCAAILSMGLVRSDVVTHTQGIVRMSLVYCSGKNRSESSLLLSELLTVHYSH